MLTLTRKFILALTVSIFSAITLYSSSLFASPEVWKQQGWKTDFTKTSIKFNQILSGGPPKDGIPSIDKPRFVPLAQIKDIGKDEPVITIAINGNARAYPLRILMWHEIVNDTLSGIPIAVTYCPLCNSAIIFKRKVGDKVLDFGTTGKLRNSDLVMYDRQTESWWQQFTGEAIVGSYLSTSLESLPARVEAFELFGKRYPDGKVLVPNDPGFRNYGANPYFRYDSRNSPYGFFTGDLPKDINPMARVIVFKNKGKATAVALNHLRQKQTLTIGDITLKWSKGQNSALDSDNITKGRDVGNVIVQKKTDKGMQDIVYDVTFAFVFHSFHKGLPIIKG